MENFVVVAWMNEDKERETQTKKLDEEAKACFKKGKRGWESKREKSQQSVCECVRIMTINQMFNDFVSGTAVAGTATTAFVSRYVIILIITFLLRLGPGTHFCTPVTDFHCKWTDKTLYLFTYAHLFHSILSLSLSLAFSLQKKSHRAK